MTENNRLQQLHELWREDPDDLFYPYAIALEYEKNDNPVKAIQLIEEIISKSPEDLSFYYKLAELYFQTEQQEKAIETTEKGIKIAVEQKNLKVKNELEQLQFLNED